MKYFYTLYQDGSLVVTSNADESHPLVKKVWLVDLSKRENAWIFILEAIKSGARTERIKELMVKWEINPENAPHFKLATGLKVKFKDGLPYLKK